MPRAPYLGCCPTLVTQARQRQQTPRPSHGFISPHQVFFHFPQLRKGPISRKGMATCPRK